MAFAGLFLVGFALVFPKKQILELNLRSSAINTEAKILSIQIEALRSEVALAKQSKEQPAVTHALKLAERLIELEIKTVQLEGKSVEGNHLIVDIENTVKLLQGSGIFGVLFSALGFWLWFKRIQNPQDQLLQNQLIIKPDALSKT